MTDRVFREAGGLWYRFLVEQIRVHGWTDHADYSQMDREPPYRVADDQLIEFRYPETTAILELTYPPARSRDDPALTLSFPCDPSFGDRVPEKDREPFVWALADAHEKIAARYSGQRTTTYSSPDVVLSVEVTRSLSAGKLQETVLGITLSTVAIAQLHAGLFTTIDQYRAASSLSTSDAVTTAFGFDNGEAS